MSDTLSKVEVITGVARRRRFSTDLKLAVIAETMQPGMSISYVARRHGLSPSLVFRWRRLMSEGGPEGNIIPVFICKLRKLCPYPIKTSHNVGYSISVSRPVDEETRLSTPSTVSGLTIARLRAGR